MIVISFINMKGGVGKTTLSTNFSYNLAERDEESKKENEALKELIKELQETHNQKIKSQTDLLASINRLSKQVSSLT